MKAKTNELLEQIDAAHDWTDGQVYSQGGTSMRSTDVCRICSLRRHWSSDRQNGNHGEFRFSDGETGNDLSLRQAAKRGCEGEE